MLSAKCISLSFSMGFEPLTFCVVTLSPVVAGPALPENEVVWTENAAVGTAPHRVHRTRLQVHKDGPSNTVFCKF
jgi:hypothetical protein